MMTVCDCQIYNKLIYKLVWHYQCGREQNPSVIIEFWQNLITNVGSTIFIININLVMCNLKQHPLYAGISLFTIDSVEFTNIIIFVHYEKSCCHNITIDCCAFTTGYFNPSWDWRIGRIWRITNPQKLWNTIDRLFYSNSNIQYKCMSMVYSVKHCPIVVYSQPAYIYEKSKLEIPFFMYEAFVALMSCTLHRHPKSWSLGEKPIY